MPKMPEMPEMPDMDSGKTDNGFNMPDMPDMPDMPEIPFFEEKKKENIANQQITIPEVPDVTQVHPTKGKDFDAPKAPVQTPTQTSAQTPTQQNSG